MYLKFTYKGLCEIKGYSISQIKKIVESMTLGFQPTCFRPIGIFYSSFTRKVFRPVGV